MEDNVKERIQEEREIVFMTHPTAQFVSLVSRGANQIPFKVVKIQNRDGGSEMVKKVVQAIIAPKELGEKELRECLGQEIATEEKRSFGKSVKYEQFRRDLCKPESFELVVLDEARGIKGLAAELAEQEDKNFVVKLFKRQEKIAAMELPEAVQGVGDADVRKMIGEGLYEEFMALVDVIRGLLGQTMSDGKEKIAQIQQAFTNFIEYLNDALTITKLADLPVVKPERQDSAVEKVGRTMTQEEMQEMITKATEPLSAEVAVLKTALEESTKKSNEALTNALKTIEALRAQVEKLERTPAALVKLDSGDPMPARRVKEKETPVFKGVLFRDDDEEEEDEEAVV